jgi:hypothetical protein
MCGGISAIPTLIFGRPKTSLSPGLSAPLSRKLSTGKAAALTGFAAADFSRMRNANYDWFTLDCLTRMLST